jgi:hypothetical protein
MLSRRDLLFAGGGVAAAIAVDAGYQRMSRAPSIAKSLRQISDNAMGWLTPQLFGARGDGGDDTVAFEEMAAAAARERRPIHLPDPGGRYCLGPWTLPSVEGLRISGASSRSGALVPISSNQPYVLFVPYGAVGCVLEDLFIFDAERSPNDRCEISLLSDCAQGLRVRRMRVDGAKRGLWFREGGYLRAEDIYVARASDRYFSFGGSKSKRQLAQGWFYELTCDSGLQDGGQDASTGIAFDIDSGAAFLHFFSPTAAGQDVGFRVHDTAAEGLNSRPDGLFIWDANIDWVRSEAVLVNAVGRMLMQGANLRSVESFAARLSGFGSIEWASTNVYGSHQGGISIDGGFNDFYFKGGSRVIGNGPVQGGGVGIRLQSGSGQAYLEGGIIGNGDDDARPGKGYYSLATTSRQDYGLVVAEQYVGNIVVNGTSFARNRIAPFAGLIVDARLRTKTRIQNVDAFRTDSFGIALCVPDRATGKISIEHNLPLPPTWYRIDPPEKNVEVHVEGVDAHAINLYLRNANGTVLLEGQYEARWEARI